MTPQEFAAMVAEAGTDDFVKVRRHLGSWTVGLTNKGRAAMALFMPEPKSSVCCPLHKSFGCCDPNDCGPCCPNCPTCPTLHPELRT